MPKIDNPQQENLGKILKGISLLPHAISGMTCFLKTGRPNPNISPFALPLRCLPHVWLKTASDEVVLPPAAEEIISPAFWNRCPAFGTEKDFSH